MAEVVAQKVVAEVVAQEVVHIKVVAPSGGSLPNSGLGWEQGAGHPGVHCRTQCRTLKLPNQLLQNQHNKQKINRPTKPPNYLNKDDKTIYIIIF